jgi:prepilin-type N-terminal cleavage/methylation domain-containing protein
MKVFRRQKGFTLIEAMVVIAITVVLIGLVLGVASRIDTQSKERQLRGTFAQLNSALQEFAAYGYRYKPIGALNQDIIDFYNSLNYPLDCSEFEVGALAFEIAFGLGATNVSINPPWINPSLAHDPEGKDQDIYSSSAAMYFFLNEVPTCREILSKIDTRFLTNKDKFGNEINIYITTGSRQRVYPLTFVLDPWKKPLRYDYYDETLNNFIYRQQSIKNFPVITSAGSDGEFGTGDDIKSR